MRLVLVYPDLLEVPGWRGYYYEGVASLGAAAAAAGHEPRLVHVTRPESKPGEVLNRIREAAGGEPALVAFSATTTQLHHIRGWARPIRETLRLPMIAGGIHPTLEPHGTFRELPELDWLGRGDGEELLVRLLDSLERGVGPPVGDGLWARDRQTGEIREGGIAPSVDLATLPFPRRDLFAFREMAGGREGYLSASGSRGCPYGCTYCCNSALRSLYRERGPYLRQKPPERFVAELEGAVRGFPGRVEGIFFEDDVFGLRQEWLARFLELFRARIGLPFGCNLRPELVVPGRVELLRQGGCRRVHVGLESGDGQVRSEVLGRKITDAALERAFRLLHGVGIQVLAYNLLGLPGEDPPAVLRTLKLNARLKPDWVQHSIFFPFPGTELHGRCLREGLLADRRVADYFVDTALELPGLTRSQVLFYQARFKALVAWYRRLLGLPRWLRLPAEGITDRLLRSPWVARLAGLLLRRPR